MNVQPQRKKLAQVEMSCGINAEAVRKFYLRTNCFMDGIGLAFGLAGSMHSSEKYEVLSISVAQSSSQSSGVISMYSVSFPQPISAVIGWHGGSNNAGSKSTAASQAVNALLSVLNNATPIFFAPYELGIGYTTGSDGVISAVSQMSDNAISYSYTPGSSTELKINQYKAYSDLYRGICAFLYVIF